MLLRSHRGKQGGLRFVYKRFIDALVLIPQGHGYYRIPARSMAKSNLGPRRSVSAVGLDHPAASSARRLTFCRPQHLSGSLLLLSAVVHVGTAGSREECMQGITVFVSANQCFRMAYDERAGGRVVSKLMLIRPQTRLLASISDTPSLEVSSFKVHRCEHVIIVLNRQLLKASKVRDGENRIRLETWDQPYLIQSSENKLWSVRAHSQPWR